MYQGKGYSHKFNKISDFMHRYESDGRPVSGGRPAQEYRAERRNTARLSYRIAKKALRAQESRDS